MWTLSHSTALTVAVLQCNKETILALVCSVLLKRFLLSFCPLLQALVLCAYTDYLRRLLRGEAAARPLGGPKRLGRQLGWNKMAMLKGIEKGCLTEGHCLFLLFVVEGEGEDLAGTRGGCSEGEVASGPLTS